MTTGQIENTCLLLWSKSCTELKQLHLVAIWSHQSTESPGSAPFFFFFLTKMLDYWTKIKHLPTNLWTGSQSTERTAILRSLFSCLLLWFHWAGELCLVPPNPQSLDPINHSIWLRRCGWQRQDASIYLLYPVYSPGLQPRCFFFFCSFNPLPTEDLMYNKCFCAFVSISQTRNIPQTRWYWKHKAYR